MAKDMFTKKWIIDNSLEIVERYEKGVLTLRALHYQLVAIGMTNTISHYKRVVAAMGDARWNGLIDFDVFSDRDRAMVGETRYEQTILEDKIHEAKRQIGLWMTMYSKNRWENQAYYIEVLIEKKALEGVFAPICKKNHVALGACKGYPSITFLHEATLRFKIAEECGKIPIIIYFGDYDPSGEDIPRAMVENIKKLGCESIQLERISLLHEQVLEWGLPPAPAKEGDSRTKNWDGLGQVELDAVKPEKLQEMCQEAIDSYFDFDLYDELNKVEDEESEIYQKELRNYVNNEL